MTNHRSDSQSKLTDAAKVVRLVDVKSARKEATPPSEGIRPTKEGPWDPCRFQEYEVSPEFRLQIMTAKPPPADPELFAEPFAPTPVAELMQSELSGDMQKTTPFGPKDFQPISSENIGFHADRDDVPSASTTDKVGLKSLSPPKFTNATRAPQSNPSRKIKALVLAGALLGLIAGFTVARFKKQGTGLAASAIQSASMAVSVAPTTSLTGSIASPRSVIAAGETPAIASPQPTPQENTHQEVVSKAAAQARQVLVEPGATNTQPKQSATKRAVPRSKNSQPTDSFPMSPDD